MTDQDDKPGYRRPPKDKQWKPGQTGNPKKVRRKAEKKLWQVIEDELAKPVTVTIKGQKQRVSVLATILHQLWLKVLDGNGAAFRVWVKYQAFAKAHPDTIVVKEDDATDTESRANTFMETMKKYNEGL